MSITYPLPIPSSPGAKSLKIVPNNLVGLSVGEFDGQQQAQEWSGEWFEGQMTLPAMLRAQAEAWCAFLCALRGVLGTFLLPCYSCRNPQGTAVAATVNGAHAAQSIVLNVTMTGTLLAGDYLQVTEESGSPLAGASHLHKVLTDASGNAALDIFPRLRGILNGGETITLLNPLMTCRLATNKREWDVDEAQTFGISFPFREAF